MLAYVDGLMGETVMGVGSWTVCSVGMMVFNKMAIGAFPEECTLTALQMLVTAVALVIFCYQSLHIGSAYDVLRWSMVAPFFSGMLLTSLLALKNAPMTLVIVFRCLSPLVSLAIERLYPNPLRITPYMVFSIFVMLIGTAAYTSQLRSDSFVGIEWVMLNMAFAIGDRLLQRLMLAKDQHPVDISKTGVTLLNNVLGFIPVAVAALIKGELSRAPAELMALNGAGISYVVASCIVGLGISYTGVWAQSLISATSFLVLVNANKFAIIFFEAFFLRTKILSPIQLLGALLTVSGGVIYGRARTLIEKEEKANKESKETSALLASPEIGKAS